MSTLEVFGVRLYRCSYRAGHPLIFENLYTGQKIEETEVEWKRGVVDSSLSDGASAGSTPA
jgi:hypothetical protein